MAGLRGRAAYGIVGPVGVRCGLGAAAGEDQVSGDPRFAQAVETTISTYDRIAENYAERNGQMGRFWRERMERFVDLVRAAEEAAPIAPVPPPEPDADLDTYLRTVPVLDAGCGPGRDARALAGYGLPVLGIDLSQGMLDAAHERTARRLPLGMIRYSLMDLRRLDLPDGCCRAVWCSASLLHLPKHVAPRAVVELARVARPGAPLALFLKLAGQSDDQTFHPYVHTDVPDARRFFAYYAPDEAARVVEAAGFSVTDTAVALTSPPPDAPGWLSVLATRG